VDPCRQYHQPRQPILHLRHSSIDAHDKKRPRKATRWRTKGQSSFSGISFSIIRAWRSAHSACIQSGIYSRHTGSARATYPEGEKSSKYSSRVPRHNRPTCRQSCRHANRGSSRVSLTRRGHQTATPQELIQHGSSRVPFAFRAYFRWASINIRAWSCRVW
jgi:hypothetical protein